MGVGPWVHEEPVPGPGPERARTGGGTVARDGVGVAVERRPLVQLFDGAVPAKLPAMGDLLVAQVIWLLGQDEEWMRPRTSALRVAAAAGALVDLGAATWVDDEDEPAVEPIDAAVPDGLLHDWAGRLVEARSSGSLPVIHALNAVSPGVWDALGSDLAQRGCAQEVPRRVRRWLPPRRRPRGDIAEQLRTHLLRVVRGTDPVSERDHGVLAVASCAGVLEHVLSRTAFTDMSVLAPTQAFLEDSDLVPRLAPALSYIVSAGPGLGYQPSWPGIGS